jgi:hypothetical protein
MDGCSRKMLHRRIGPATTASEDELAVRLSQTVADRRDGGTYFYLACAYLHDLFSCAPA